MCPRAARSTRGARTRGTPAARTRRRRRTRSRSSRTARPAATSSGRSSVSDVVLETKGLVKHFPITQGILFKSKVGAVRAVDGVDLHLRRGETLGVVGESGCGKSTLAKLLVGLEKPTAGEINVRGQDMVKLS